MNCQLQMPNQAKLFDHILSNADYAKEMVGADTHTGQTVVICGAGPSLAAHLRTLPDAHQVWACNSALPYLKSKRVRVTHGFAIDQGDAMLGPNEWERTFAVPYYVASSVHPKLVAHLLKERRRLKFFHSYLGIPDPDGWTPPDDRPGVSYEMWLYTTKYADSVQVGYGLNSVPRAVCLALFMGFRHIVVYGADCACAPDQPPMPELATPAYVDWINALPMYADGRTAGASYGVDAVMAEAVIDGTRWHTRADMVISAVHLLDLQRSYPDRITFAGQTLPNALKDKPTEFMANMPRLESAGNVVGFGAAR